MENQTDLTVRLNRNNINFLGADGRYLRYEYQQRLNRSQTRWTKAVYQIPDGESWSETVTHIIELVRGVRAEVEYGDYR